MNHTRSVPYLVVATLLLLFGGVVWLIHREGEQTREAIRAAASDAGAAMRRGIIRDVARSLDEASNSPDDAPRKTKRALSAEVSGKIAASSRTQDEIDTPGDEPQTVRSTGAGKSKKARIEITVSPMDNTEAEEPNDTASRSNTPDSQGDSRKQI